MQHVVVAMARSWLSELAEIVRRVDVLLQTKHSLRALLVRARTMWPLWSRSRPTVVASAASSVRLQA